MAGYKAPDFRDRVAAATQARAKALAQLQAKPALDPAVQAERAAKAVEREAAKAQKREALQAEREAGRAAKLAKAEAERLAMAKPELTEAERKAARDARYAARKSRKK